MLRNGNLARSLKITIGADGMLIDNYLASKKTWVKVLESFQLCATSLKMLERISPNTSHKRTLVTPSSGFLRELFSKRGGWRAILNKA